jgi:hypothetical protein
VSLLYRITGYLDRPVTKLDGSPDPQRPRPFHQAFTGDGQHRLSFTGNFQHDPIGLDFPDPVRLLASRLMSIVGNGLN